MRCSGTRTSSLNHLQENGGHEHRTDCSANVSTTLLWYAKDRRARKVPTALRSKKLVRPRTGEYTLRMQLPMGTRRPCRANRRVVTARGVSRLSASTRLDAPGDSRSRQPTSNVRVFKGETFQPGRAGHWKTHDANGLQRLPKRDAICRVGTSALRTSAFLDDFPAYPIDNTVGRHSAESASRPESLCRSDGPTSH